MKIRVLKSHTIYFDGRLQPEGAILDVDDDVAKAWIEREVAEAVKDVGPAESKPASATENTSKTATENTSVAAKQQKPKQPKEKK